MANPIKSTPVLKGRDAINFFVNLDSNKNKKVDKEQLVSIRKSAQLLNAILKVN